MKIFAITLGLIMALLVSISQCSSQVKKQNMINTKDSVKKVNRPAAVAGQFYSSDPAELKTVLKGFFDKAKPPVSKDVVAIISPHAGYVYSGQVAASAFNQIDTGKTWDNIFIIASSHHDLFDGASIYTEGNYETPLGEVKVNMELALKIKKSSKVFDFSSTPHLMEHSLEVQLPFLQYIMKKDFRIIPIIMGTQNGETCRKIADALKPYFNGNNLFIISSDFSHYPQYKDAVRVDKLTADAIIANSPSLLKATLSSNSAIGLETSLCGWTSVLTLLYMTQDNPDISVTLVDYKNSGDVSFGDKSRVVGYNAIAFSLKNNHLKQGLNFKLNDEEKKLLLSIARKTIESYLSTKKIPAYKDELTMPEALMKPCGAFVTLYKNKELRGCIGNFTSTEPLYKVVQEMAVAAAVNDYRFSPVTTDELKDITIEISVLTPMRKISSINEIVLGKHGIYIVKGSSAGTFLPQVATETNWTLEEFLGHCARDKAGIGWDGWKTADIYVYEALVFGD